MSLETDHRDLYARVVRLYGLRHALKEAVYGFAMIEKLRRHDYELSTGAKVRQSFCNARTAGLLLCLVPLPAHAYIGPALAFTSYLFGPVIAILAAVAMLLAWPAWKLVQKIRGKPVTEGDDGKTEE